MTLRTFALIFGIVFLLVGIAGFLGAPLMQMPNPDQTAPTVMANYGNLLGLFPVNMIHSLVHVLFGAWGIAAYFGVGGPRLYARGVAIIYAVLTVAGFIPNLDTLFGLAPLYGNDIWLHALLALVAAYFGWGFRDAGAPAAR